MPEVPQDLDAERAVLGACMLENEAAGLALEILTPEDFREQRHALVFRALRKLLLEGKSADEVLVCELLGKLGHLQSVGADYVHEVVSSVPSAANIEQYAEIVKQKAIARRHIEACYANLRDAEAPGDIWEILDAAQSRLNEVGGSEEKSEATPIADDLPDLVRRLEERHKNPKVVYGLPAGLRVLDTITGGLHPGQMIILAARPGIGKSALALGILDRTCRGENARPALMFSMEQPRDDLEVRLLAGLTGISYNALQGGYFPSLRWNEIIDGCAELSGSKLILDATSGISLYELTSKARRLHARDPLALVVVDYLQLMGHPKARSQEEELSILSGGLKNLARQLEIPLVALCQFRKAAQGHEGAAPHMEELKGSSAFRQDADVILILHRKSRPADKGGGYENETDLNIAKQRNGPVGIEHIWFQPERIRFVDMRAE